MKLEIGNYVRDVLSKLMALVRASHKTGRFCKKFFVTLLTTLSNNGTRFFVIVFTRDSIYAISRICHGNSVCLSVCLSVCHTGGSVKNG